MNYVVARGEWYKKGKTRITAGCILVFLQAIGVIGSVKEGVDIIVDFTNPMVLLYDLVFLFGFYFVGIIGIILIACGTYARYKKPKQKKSSDKSEKNIDKLVREEPCPKERQPTPQNVISTEINNTTPVIKEKSTAKSHRKPKVAVIVLSIVCGLLVVALVLTMLPEFIGGNNSSESKENKSDDFLYDWLIENGTLDDDGTSLDFRITDEHGNVYTLYYSTYNGFLQASFIEKQDDYEIITSLPILKNSHPKFDVEFSCNVSNSEGKERGIECSHTPYNFTRKTPIEKGDATGDTIFLPDYDEAERKTLVKVYDEMLDIADNLARENLCKILDWLNNTVCPLADCTLSDLGYYEYK